MAERIEYQGDALPSGLPGFGGGTVSVLILPGFNRIIAPQKFGPAVDAPVTPPDPTPPPGNTPDNPAPGPVSPGPAPTPSPGPGNFCKQCADQKEDSENQSPIMYGKFTKDRCVDCSGNKKDISYYAPQFNRKWEVTDSYIGSVNKELQFNDGQNDRLYKGKKIKVCVDGESKDWYILAFEEGEYEESGGA